jgi:hypothetical protein
MKIHESSSKKKNSLKKIRRVDDTTVGIDVGDQWSHYCVLNKDGEVIGEGRFRTKPEALARLLQSFVPVTRWFESALARSTAT